MKAKRRRLELESEKEETKELGSAQEKQTRHRYNDD